MRTSSVKYDEPQNTPDDYLLFNIVYCSQMRPGLGITDVDAIVATSHRRNPLLGITGLLTFGSEIFFQWIEGPKLEVLDLIKLIETDNRHENMVILSSDEEVRERIFPNWDMELVSADDINGDPLTFSITGGADQSYFDIETIYNDDFGLPLL